MKNKATTKNKVLFRAVLAVFLLAFNMSVQSAVELPNGIYHETVDDLVVKVMGGYVKAQRTWYAGKWYHTRAWNNLQIEYNALDGSVNRLGRNYDVYEKANSGLYTYADNTKSLSETESGYRWTDKHGNWIDYAKDGRIIKYGDRNNVEVSFIYNAEGQRTGVKDHFGNQVLWYEYNTAGQVISVRDQVDPAQARIVKYQYTDGLLTQVIDVLGNTWSYSYKWTKTDSGSSSLGTTGSGGGTTGISTSRMDYTLLLTSRTDPEGRTVTIEYNPNKRVAAVKKANGTGPSYEYGYDKTKKEYYTRETQSSGRVDETWFNKDGEVIRRDVNGLTVETVKIDGNTYTHTNELGYKTISQYDNKKNLIKETYPDGNSKSWKYDGKYSNVLEFANERGVVTKYEYDEFGNRIRMIEALGYPEERTTEHTYDEYGNILSEKRLADSVTDESLAMYTYDEKGNLLSIKEYIDSDASKQTTFIEYNVSGQLLKWEDARGNIWGRTYDKAGNILSEIDPYNNGTYYEYDNCSNLKKFTNSNNESVRLNYEYGSRVSSIIDPMGGIVKKVYDEHGRLKHAIDQEGSKITIEYDELNRYKKFIDGVGNQIDIVYGNQEGSIRNQFISKIVYPTYVRSFIYDSRSRRIKINSHVNNKEIISIEKKYDEVGNLVEYINQNGIQTYYAYDALNRLINVTYSSGASLKFVYDNRNNLIRIINQKNVAVRDFRYDRLDRVTQVTWPLGETFRYTYDNNNNLLEYKDAEENLTKYKYDSANRLLSTSYFRRNESVPSKVISYSYNSVGRLIRYEDGTASSEYEYNALGKRILETINFGPFTKTIKKSYYKNGLKRSITTPSKKTYTYYYDSGNRLNSIDIPNEGRILFSDYTWYKPSKITYPGGNIYQREYDPIMRVKRILAKDPSGKALLDHKYSYDKRGNILKKITLNNIYTYAYDQLDQILNNDINGQSIEDFEYDPAGNIIKKNAGEEWIYNKNNQLVSDGEFTYTYNANGSLVLKSSGFSTTEYEYDIDNKLKGVRKGNIDIASYLYDPFGRRIYKNVNGNIIYYLYDDEGLIAEYDSVGSLVRGYSYKPNNTWGSGVLFASTNNEYAYYLTDQLGSAAKLIRKSGSVIWSGNYKSYGEVVEDVNGVNNNLHFPGHYHDNETGLNYNYYRYYSPYHGRYIKSDPIDISGGINFYSYASNNPINYFDPFGLKCFITVYEFGEREGEGFDAILEFYDDEYPTRFIRVRANTWPTNNNLNPGIKPGTYWAIYKYDGHRRERDGVRIEDGAPIPTLELNPNYARNPDDPGDYGQEAMANGVNIHCVPSNTRRGSAACVTIPAKDCKKLFDSMVGPLHGEKCTVEIIR